MPTFRVLLAALAAASVLATTPVQARRAEFGRSDAGVAGNFDYYLLSLSVAPSFCALSPGNAAKRECRTLTADAFRQTPLTIHGLWPNRARVSVNRQPQDCDGPPLELSPGVQSELRQLMPGGPGLARYEWRKHGTCSGLSADSYFGTAAKLARAANEAIGPSMQAGGGALRIDELLRTVGAANPALAAAIVVDCRYPRGGGEALVEEIRITLSKDLRPIPAASVGLGQNSGCPNGAGRIPQLAR
jgi:ribonuclease T2